jgi:L-2-hydroxyglutarate oxidase
MNYDVVLIGAGIVGTATAMHLLEQQPNLRVCVVEKEDTVAKHQSGSNSGVIHSGIYYKPGSLKALNCRKGYMDLIKFCDMHGVPYEICGKIIAAVDEEEASRLPGILERGKANGLEGIRLISSDEAREIEPHVNCVSAIFVPQTGIINYPTVAAKQLEIAQTRGAEVRFNTRVTGMRRLRGETIVETDNGTLHCKIAVNCAGLFSDKVAAMTGQSDNLQILPFRGEYYDLVPERTHLVRNLIYPVPNPAFPFLGVHFTRMIEGGVEAGPNAVIAFRREGYSRWDFHAREFLEMVSFPGLHQIASKYWRLELDEMHRSFFKSAFVKALQRLMPAIQEEDLVRGRAGVRAQACDRQGNLIDDFLIRRSKGVVHVLNAPSPAATASLAIGETIAKEVLSQK